MKGGLVIALFAADALARADCRPRRPAVFLWTSDEETGSATSRAVIEREARRSAAVLVLEPASGLDGRLKTQRKGIGSADKSIAVCSAVCQYFGQKSAKTAWIPSRDSYR